MTVRGSPSSMSVRPMTPGSEPKMLTQARWAMTATGGAPGAASGSAKVRPSRGPTPRNAKPFGVIHAIVNRCAPASFTQCTLSTAGADDVLEHLGLLLVVEELGRRKIRPADDFSRAVLQDDVDQAIGARVGKWIQHHVAKNAVDDRDRADPEREGQHRDEREAGRSGEAPKCVADIAPRVVQPQEGLALVIIAGHAASGPSFHQEVNSLLMFACA